MKRRTFEFSFFCFWGAGLARLGGRLGLATRGVQSAQKSGGRIVQGYDSFFEIL
jgi:hypothetical protein